MTRPARPPNSSQRGREDHRFQQEPGIVSGRWLVRALVATLLAASAALYLTVCLLFYQGQWQFVFSPPRPASPVNVSDLAVRSGLPIADVRFDYTEQGIAYLDGWWIPANPPPTDPTVVLYCPNGRTTLRANIAALQAFHQLGTAVFAFDYRGFGQSQSSHPSQQKAYADGLAALRYLTDTRHIQANHIVVYGAGVGTAVAVHIAQQSPGIAGLILENPQPSFARQVKREQHIRMLPLWLVFPDRFDISQIIGKLRMPKLFLLLSENDRAADLYRQALPPKRSVIIPASSAATLYERPAWQHALGDFLKDANAHLSDE